MKKLFCLLLCVICLLAGCGENGGEQSAESSAESSFAPDVSGGESKGESAPAVSEDASHHISREISTEVSDEISEEDTLPKDKVTHREPFWTNNGKEVVVHPEFPAPESFQPASAIFEQGFSDLFLVTEMDEYGFYGATQLQFEARTYIWGSYPDVKAGDYVFVSCSSAFQYVTSDGSFHYVFSDEVTECRVVVDEDLGDYLWVAPEKPVIYLYPTEETTVSVKLDYHGRLTCTYPLYEDGKGWENLTVFPDGTIRKGGKEYYCLYWEGEGPAKYDFAKGFCVKGEDTAAFLETALAEMGLTAREANEFIIYWLPRMEKNPYNVISFQTETYTATAPLEISPIPDSMLRVFMAYYPAAEYAEMLPQEFEGFERIGFTVVEWGGAEVKRG